MKEIKTFVCHVDAYRNGMIFRTAKEQLYKRQTEGTYFVGAKTRKEAAAILREKIGFGSVDVSKSTAYAEELGINLEYKQVAKFENKYDQDSKRWEISLEYDIKHATAPIEKEG